MKKVFMKLLPMYPAKLATIGVVVMGMGMIVFIGGAFSDIIKYISLVIIGIGVVGIYCVALPWLLIESIKHRGNS